LFIKIGLALRLNIRLKRNNGRKPDDPGRGLQGFTAGIEEALLFVQLP
jgi:hypothetical protein